MNFGVKTSVLKKTWNYSWPHNSYYLKVKTRLTRNLLLTTHSWCEIGIPEVYKSQASKIATWSTQLKTLLKRKSSFSVGPIGESIMPAWHYIHAPRNPPSHLDLIPEHHSQRSGGALERDCSPISCSKQGQHWNPAKLGILSCGILRTSQDNNCTAPLGPLPCLTEPMEQVSSINQVLPI